MAPRLSLFTARSVAFRSNPFIPPKPFSTGLSQRGAGDGAPKKSTEVNSSVCEEQAAVDKTTGETPPDIQQGTPILQRDKDAQKNAPEVLKAALKGASGGGSSGKRAFSTSSRRRALSANEGLTSQPDSASTDALIHFQGTQADGIQYSNAGLGRKFALPVGRVVHLKKRYDPCVDQFTKSIMQHGKLSQAQKNMASILDTLRTAPAPQANVQFPNRALLTSLPREALPLYPVAYLTTVVDSLAPLIKIRQQRGVIGGGASLPVPMPMALRQRRRTAIQWILQSAGNRRETKLADRVAREIISVAEGKSGAWEKRQIVHKQAISARSNLRLSQSRKVRSKSIK